MRRSRLALSLLVILVLFLTFVFVSVCGRNYNIYIEYVFGTLKDALWAVQRPLALVFVPLLLWRVCRRSRPFCVGLLLGDLIMLLLLLKLFPYHPLLR